MKRLLIVCTALATLCCLAYAAEKTVPVPVPLGVSAAVQNQTVAPQTEYGYAKQLYIRKQEGSLLNKDEEALVDKYFGERDQSGGSLDNTGGPDQAYYYWVDNQADTVLYNWIELRGDPGATWIGGWSNYDDGCAPSFPNIGFNFPFYGSNYTVIKPTSNYQLEFGTSCYASSYTSCLSATATYGPAIMPYMADGHLQRGGDATGNNVVGYENFGSYFVIEYDSGGYYSTSYTGSSLKFEVILWPSGLIKIQYNNIVRVNGPAYGTVGILSGTTTANRFLQYRCYSQGDLVNPLTNGRAVVFVQQIPQVSELGVSMLSPCGILAQNPSQQVSLRITNNGGAASSNVTAYFSFDGGATTDNYAVPPIAPSSFFDVFFSVPINLPNNTSHTLSGWFLPHDNPSGNDSTACTITVQRPCNSCTPADVNLDPVPSLAWAGNVDGNDGNAGKWVGSFTAQAGCVYHFDLCPDAPGNTIDSANFDADIKICDANCTILAGVDGTCAAESYRPNDFQWTATTPGTYYAIIAPYSSYSSHTCGGTANSIFHLGYYVYCPPPCFVNCQSGDIPECPENPADPTFAWTDCNGGCNNNLTSVFPNCPSGPPTFGQIACGQTVCGTSFTYNGPERSGVGTQFRDTDWFLFTLAQDESIRVVASAEFPLLLGIAAGVAPCNAPSFVVSTTQSALCTETVLTANCLPAGTYAVFVAINSFTGFPNPLHYRVSLQCGGICPPCPFESLDLEPVNNTCGADAPMVQCGNSYCGTRNPGTDNDFYKLVLTERDSVKINVFANVTPGHFPFGRGLDSYVEFYDANCGLLYYNDDFHGAAGSGDPEGFDSGLRLACLNPGTYYINVKGFSTSVGPYVLQVICTPCCTSTPEAVFAAAPIPYYICADLCNGSNTNVTICPLPGTVFQPGDFPIVTVTPGCSPTNTRCDRDCSPGQGLYDPAGWVLGSDGCWHNHITGLQPGCVCICLEGFLAVELNSFAATSGDNSVTLTWATRSETNAARYDVERNGETVAQVTATNNASGHEYTWVDHNVTNGTTYSYTLVGVDVNGGRSNLATQSVTPSFGAAVITEYALHQNFPNPFNPTTTITFDLVQAGNVSLKVYNVMGQEIATLVNSELGAGRHMVTFDAGNLPSGLYLYRISANGFSAEQKMLLMK